MSTILFFDTETSGLPNFKARNSDPSQPYVLQLAGLLCDEEGNTLEEYCVTIQPGNDNPIHPAAQAAHGLSLEHIKEVGIPQLSAYIGFMDLADKADTIIAHNYNFDIRLLAIMASQLSDVSAGCTKEDYEIFKAKPHDCTMMKTTKFCALPFPSGRKGNKFPKLEELYEILFREKMSDKYGAHDALEDVKATRDCYFELKSRGLM